MIIAIIIKDMNTFNTFYLFLFIRGTYGLRVWILLYSISTCEHDMKTLLSNPNVVGGFISDFNLSNKIFLCKDLYRSQV